MPPLFLDPSSARSLIESSEGRSGIGEYTEGHTKRQHVTISRHELAARMGEPDPIGRSNGKIFWRSAFTDINSCASLLSSAINALDANPFVRNFSAIANGEKLHLNGPILLNAFVGRDQRGLVPNLNYVQLGLQKVVDRPHSLHLITFYPVII